MVQFQKRKRSIGSFFQAAALLSQSSASSPSYEVSPGMPGAEKEIPSSSTAGEHPAPRTDSSSSALSGGGGGRDAAKNGNEDDEGGASFFSAEDNDDADECPVCLEALSCGAVQVLPCSHRFHRACVKQLRSSSVSQECPMCCAKLPAPSPASDEKVKRLDNTTKGISERQRDRANKAKERANAARGQASLTFLPFIVRSQRQSHSAYCVVLRPRVLQLAQIRKVIFLLAI